MLKSDTIDEIKIRAPLKTLVPLSNTEEFTIKALF